MNTGNLTRRGNGDGDREEFSAAPASTPFPNGCEEFFPLRGKALTDSGNSRPVAIPRLTSPHRVLLLRVVGGIG